MNRVLVEYRDGGATHSAVFDLLDGRLHLPTISKFFRLANNVRLDGVVHAIDASGFTFANFESVNALQVTGNAQRGGWAPPMHAPCVLLHAHCHSLKLPPVLHCLHGAHAMRMPALR
jgi:hypothetical protein